jgi:hypothetical protein
MKLDVLNQIEQEILEEEEGNSSDSEVYLASKKCIKRQLKMFYLPTPSISLIL